MEAPHHHEHKILSHLHGSTDQYTTPPAAIEKIKDAGVSLLNDQLIEATKRLLEAAMLATDAALDSVNPDKLADLRDEERMTIETTATKDIAWSRKTAFQALGLARRCKIADTPIIASGILLATAPIPFECRAGRKFIRRFAQEANACLLGADWKQAAIKWTRSGLLAKHQPEFSNWAVKALALGQQCAQRSDDLNDSKPNLRAT